jgi:drug/metabolite transporter (DMT)-like permease
LNALLALAASVLWGSSDFGGGLMSRRLHPSAAVLISQAIVLVGLLGLLPFFAVPTGGYLLTAALAGVVGTLSLTSFYRAMAQAPLSLVAPITAAGTAIPVLVGLARGERLGVLQGLGIAVTIVGVILACGPEFRAGAQADGAAPADPRAPADPGARQDPGVQADPGARAEWRARRQALIFAILAAAGFGVAYTLLALAAGSGSLYGTLLMQRIGGLVVLGPIVLGAGILGRLRLTLPRLAALAAIGTADIVANGSYALAASRGDLSIAAVLASLYPVVTALLARGILAERLRPIQSVGVITAIAGVLLLSS